MCLFNPNAEIVNKEILSKKIENDFNLDPVILISDTNLIYKTSSPQECFDLVKNGSNFDNGKNRSEISTISKSVVFFSSSICSSNLFKGKQ